MRVCDGGYGEAHNLQVLAGIVTCTLVGICSVSTLWHCGAWYVGGSSARVCFAEGEGSGWLGFATGVSGVWDLVGVGVCRGHYDIIRRL